MASLLNNLETVPMSQITTHPDNPRRGDIEAIAQSLAANDQFQPLVVQRSSSRILAGNHTYLAADLLGWQTIDVAFVDVDDVAAMKILLAANRTADLGTYDERLLLAILGDIRETDEELLLGTGYTSDDVDELLADALAYDPELDEEEDRDRVNFAASILDRLMPADPAREVEEAAEAVEEALSENEKKPKPRRPAYAPPTEFVIFRFGEIQAKVDREAYDEWGRLWLKGHDGDLAKAGVAAAIFLGIPEDKAQPAVAEGTERWL